VKKGCHLAKKLRKQRTFFFKQKMKVKPVTQFLSQCVVDAMTLCKDTLKMYEFRNASATIAFIQSWNRGFDILNSRSINCIGHKEKYAKEITLFTKHITE